MMKKSLSIILVLAISADLLLAATIQTAKASYANGEPIVVEVSGLPTPTNCDPVNPTTGNDCNWVGLFGAYDESQAQNLLAYKYISTTPSDSLTFAGLDDAMEYEARLFFNNDYVEQGFYNFPVISTEQEIEVKTIKEQYEVNEPITVSVSGLPGNSDDWLGLFYAFDGSEAQHLLQKVETGGKKDGDFTFSAGLNEAHFFEVRAFSKGTFNEEDYYPFEVISTVHPVTLCDVLQNPSFETDTNAWTVYGTNSLINGGYNSAKALSIKNGGLDQLSQEVTAVDTYQFNGHYKTVGKTDGIWLGMVFYDSDKELIMERSFFLNDVDSYTPFILNATSTPETKYIETWVWSSSEQNSGSLILDELHLSTSGCYTHTVASSLPPQGLSVDEVPQFVVLGFDDNTQAEGIDWVIDLFNTKSNSDGSDARVSFYLNTSGLHADDADGTALLASMQRLKNTTHEMGNHTDNHLRYLYQGNEEVFFQTLSTLGHDTWDERIQAASTDLIGLVGLVQNDIQGFRAPYLRYNAESMNVIKEKGFLYDCSIEEGYAPEFDGTNFRWPYELDEGSPGHDESWYGNRNNAQRVDIKTTQGLWELPNYVLMVPKDSETSSYGITTGFWNRLLTNMPYLEDHKVTGLDYNLWTIGKINKAEMLGLLKYNLDLRLSGNRAPFMFGTHSQYYTQAWADANVPNATLEEMKEAISSFVDYALSKEVVRMSTGVDIIEWCKDPQPLP